jgi:hypothetical protein
MRRDQSKTCHAVPVPRTQCAKVDDGEDTGVHKATPPTVAPEPTHQPSVGDSLPLGDGSPPIYSRALNGMRIEWLRRRRGRVRMFRRFGNGFDGPASSVLGGFAAGICLLSGSASLCECECFVDLATDLTDRP